MTPRALLVADCGSGVGLGHIERMLALADALRPDIDALMVVPDDDPALRRRVTARGHAAFEARGASPDRVETVLEQLPSMDVIVLDGYVFDAELQGRVRRRAPLTVVDDLRLPADCDLAVNPAPGGEALRPEGATAFLGGAAYALIRESIVAARDAALRRGRDVRTVLASTGATDPRGLAVQVSAELLERDGLVQVIRIVGPDTVVTSRDSRARERVLVAPADIADVLATATVYAGAAGTTAVHAACVGTPAVITATAANQQGQAAALAGAGCAIATDAAGVAGACLSLLDDPARCEAMATSGRALVDGQGAGRVAAAIRHLVAARAGS